MRELWVVSLGLTPYEEALELQRALARERISGAIPEDILLLVEHPPVVTMGRSAKSRNLISSKDFLASRGVELFEVERGGDVTFHGPGQLVGYPIIDLKRHKQDLHWFLRQVEEALIRTLAAYTIPGERSSGFTGVWTNGRKIASTSSGSSDSARDVKPTRSAKSTVTPLRSSRRGAAATSEAPQARQNRAPSGLSCPQTEHVSM